MPYLKHRTLEKSIKSVSTAEELPKIKNMVLTHIHSLMKDNRQLQRRIQNFEEKYQERKAMRKQSRGGGPSHYNHHHHQQ